MTVIGFGNEWRGDDGVGIEVARRVGGRVLEGEPIALVDVLDGDDEVVLVDAVSSGAPAGTLFRFEAGSEPLPAPLFGASSTHALGLAEAVELARSLGRLRDREQRRHLSFADRLPLPQASGDRGSNADAGPRTVHPSYR